MPKKAQVLVISLWILVILSMLAISVGRRVSLALRLSKYQRDSLRALYLAKAGINRAILEITNDQTPDSDNLSDNWASNESVFKEIRLDGNEAEFAEVNYIIRENEEEKIIYGASDEERKININTASEELLKRLLKECEIDSAKAEELSEDILVWRGSNPPDPDLSRYYEDNLGYACKGKKFTTSEELLLVKGMKEIEVEKLEKIKSLITVYGDGKVNINTAPKDVLRILSKAAVSALFKDIPGLNINETDANALVEKILSFRNTENGYFKSSDINTDTIKVKLGLQDITDDNKTKIIEKLITWEGGIITALSNNFKIQATGNAGKVNKKITAVVKRGSPIKILYWHEN